MYELETDRLYWRAPRAGDADQMYALVSDYDVVKWTSHWPYPADRTVTASQCVPLDTSLGFGGPVFLGDVMIGLIGVENGELGFMFAQAFWGWGYATEIGAAIVARAFRLTDRARLTARVTQGNNGSARVLEKLRFEYIGEGRCSSLATGVEADSFEYSLTRDSWRAST